MPGPAFPRRSGPRQPCRGQRCRAIGTPAATPGPEPARPNAPFRVRTPVRPSQPAHPGEVELGGTSGNWNRNSCIHRRVAFPLAAPRHRAGDPPVKLAGNHPASPHRHLRFASPRFGPLLTSVGAGRAPRVLKDRREPLSQRPLSEACSSVHQKLGDCPPPLVHQKLGDCPPPPVTVPLPPKLGDCPPSPSPQMNYLPVSY